MVQDKHFPLSQYRVLDLTDRKGWLTGKILGDMGADVIKIERPGGALDRNIGGQLTSISAYTMKHPPKQFTDDEARDMVDEFIAGKRER